MELAQKEKNQEKSSNAVNSNTATDSSTNANIEANTNVPAETTTAPDANANTAANTNQQQEVITQSQGVTNTAHDALVKSNLLSSPWDISILLFFLISTFLYGLSLGRDRIIVILVSIYMSLAVVEALPQFVLNINFNGNFAFQLTTFIAVFVVLFFFVSRMAILRTIGAELSDGKWYQTIVFAFMHVGVLISITMSFLPPEIMQRFTPLTQQIFTGEWQHFAWIAAPLVAMVIFGGQKSEK